MGKMKIPATQQFNVRLPRSLYDRLIRTKAELMIKRGKLITMRELVVEALEKGLN